MSHSGSIHRVCIARGGSTCVAISSSVESVQAQNNMHEFLEVVHLASLQRSEKRKVTDHTIHFQSQRIDLAGIVTN